MASEKSIDTTVAEAYEQHMVPGMFRHWTELQVGLAAPKAGEHVLDVACGTGIGARLAAAHVGPTGRAVGIDIDPGVIELARQLSRGGETPMEWALCERAGDAARKRRVRSRAVSAGAAVLSGPAERFCGDTPRAEAFGKARCELLGTAGI